MTYTESNIVNKTMEKYISRIFKIRYVPCSKKQHGFKNNDGRNKNTNIYLNKITAIR